MTIKNKKDLEDIAKTAVISHVYSDYPSDINAFDLVINHEDEGWNIEGFVVSDIYQNYDINSQKYLLQNLFRTMFGLAVKVNQD